MPYSDIIKKLKDERIPTLEAVSGKAYSAFGSGGLIACVIEPLSVEQLITALAILSGTRYAIIACGSNILIADKGIDILLSLKRLSSITVLSGGFECLAGTRLATITALAERCGFSGAEFLVDIPGTFGGAVVMNAGAFGGEMKDILKSVTLFEDDKIVKRRPDELKMGYRRSAVGSRIVIGGILKLDYGEYNEIRELTARYREYRMRTQPFGRSLGSVFKRVDGISPAVYIEKTDLKGLTIGGAELSKKHCNFIINRGNAKSDDYLAIANRVSEEVAKQGITLELENILLGYD